MVAVDRMECNLDLSIQTVNLNCHPDVSTATRTPRPTTLSRVSWPYYAMKISSVFDGLVAETVAIELGIQALTTDPEELRGRCAIVTGQLEGRFNT